MKVVIAIDSFKGCISSEQAGAAVKKGILKAHPDAEVIVKPVSDGGEGLINALISNLECEKVTVLVSDPINRKINASYGINHSKKLAVMEMASAAGLPLLAENERDPMNTTTYGVGEMIVDALNRGCRDFIIGIGGSATNDGGIGMLKALGYEFCGNDSKPVSIYGKGLENIVLIDDRNVIPKLKDCHFRIACDVKNPLCGDKGCSAVFGPQKGLQLEDVVKMDSWLEKFADLTEMKYPDADRNYPGSGAAGGLGFAFRSFLNAELVPGIELMISASGLEKEIENADVVVTGEGCLDDQSIMGKVPAGIAAAAKKYNKTVIAFAGKLKVTDSSLNSCGIDACFSVLRKPMSLEEAMNPETTQKNLELTSEQVFRLIK
ncbi:MAG: glycerate kinase [Oscillospiraceae bacterium]|nr:glycerate kinase [Oscillospiraceae bacterium]